MGVVAGVAESTDTSGLEVTAWGLGLGWWSVGRLAVLAEMRETALGAEVAATVGCPVSTKSCSGDCCHVYLDGVLQRKVGEMPIMLV